MANAKCIKCDAKFELKYSRSSVAKLQCPKCGTKATPAELYDEYDRYAVVLKKQEEERKKKELEQKKIEEQKRIEELERKKTVPQNVQLTYRDGVYSGEAILVNGKRVRQGKGTFKSNDGDVYKGIWKNDLYDGEGELLQKDGFYNAGTFEAGKLKEGKTKRRLANGVYQGDINDFLFEGVGKVTLDNGQEYEGEFVKGKRSGKGVCKYASGEKYSGLWLNDMREGKGTFYHPDGAFEECIWHENKHQPNSKSYFHDSNGIIEKREYDATSKLIKKTVLNKNTARIGQIIVQTPSGLFIGDVKNNKINGIGTYYYNNGDVYEGSFRENKIDGNGVYHFGSGDKAGDRQEGSYVNNVIVGQAFYYYKDGRIEKRMYDQLGKLKGKMMLNINTCEADQRVVTFSNGDIYVGQVMDGERCGKGSYYFANGERYEGFFRNNNRHGVGTYFYTDGSFERGSFENGKKTGPFIFTNKEGKKENRVYQHDVLKIDSIYERLKDWAEV